ncbi:MAG: amidohydrolase family protein, partial [Planctomycetes bacterium]|nr:amidohydrolase family protein [Planctomycetota bacterium]
TRNIDKAWNDPRLLHRALDLGVTVVAAHCGMRSGPHDRDYFEEWAAMLAAYPNLYGDTAAIFGMRARHFLRVMNRPGIAERLIHGSDWPVPNSPWWFLGGLPLRQIWKLSRIKNPIARDLATKQALGLPIEVFTRARKILRLNY